MITYTFKRHEIKYLLTIEQYKKVIDSITPHLEIDQYGKSIIQSLYYDTPNKLLIRRSIEKPDYKEKFRIRSYGLASSNSKVFLEIKKKVEKIVYKRRILLTLEEANLFMDGKSEFDSQIAREIKYFKQYYEGLSPAMLLIYSRTAYCDNKSDLRITFDNDIKFRDFDLGLDKGFYGESILPNDMVMMEIKTSTAIPLWLTKVLSENKIFKTSFSKYGTAYRMIKEREGK